MPHYPSHLIDQLFTNIDADDEINLNIALPEQINFACTEKERADCYFLSLQMLRDYVDRREFRALIAAIIRQRSASKAQIAAFRRARSCFKHIRYSCANFDARHRYPRPLHKLTALMGDFQDAVINGQKLKTLTLGIKLWLKLSASSYRKLLADMADYHRDSDRDYYGYLTRENASLAEYLQREPLSGTGNELHNLRKIISRRVALNDTLRVFRPSDQADATSLWLATLNGVLGDLHDKLVAETLAGKRNYKSDIYTPEPMIAARCRLFLTRQKPL